MQITVYHAFLVVACSLQEHLQSNVLLFFVLVLVFVATGLDFHHSCLKQLLCSCGQGCHQKILIYPLFAKFCQVLTSFPKFYRFFDI